MKLQDLLKTTPETLADEQHKALKQHILGVLAEVTKAISEENYKHIKNLTCYSPAGDCMGTESFFIDFAPEGLDESDIVDMTARLIELKALSNHEN